MNYLISVIIPVYNVEEYISDCIESVLSQSYTNFEIICIDDCGQDKSIHIVEHFSLLDSRIKIIRHKKNSGLGPARNTGINASRGDYIIFLDSDDMLYPHALRNLVSRSQDFPADVTVGKVVAFPQNSDSCLVSFAKRYNKYDQRAIPGTYLTSLKEIPEECTLISVVSHGRLFRKDFIKSNNIYFINDNTVHEDDGFFLKYMACLPKILVTDSYIIHYRIRPGSIMTKLKNKDFIKRREEHLRKSLDDARKYIYNKYSKAVADSLLCKLGGLESAPYLFNYGNIFQLKWGKKEKVIRLFGVPLYKETIDRQQRKVYSLLHIPIFKKKYHFT